MRPISLTTKSIVAACIKLGIFIGIIWATYQHVQHTSLWVLPVNEWKQLFNLTGVFYLVLALLLIPVNWSLETLKWQQLIRQVYKLPFATALQNVLAGLALSLFTPNRIGEYGGRIINIPKNKRWPIVAASLLASYAQLLVTLSISSLGSLCLLYTHLPSINAQLHININHTALMGITIALILAIIICLLFYFNLKPLHHKLSNLGSSTSNNRYKKFLQHIGIVQNIQARHLWATLFLAALRYCVFSTQYVLLLWFFNIPLSFIEAFTWVAAVYCLQTILPSIAIAELGIRGNIALWLSAMVGISGSASLLATALLWFINLLLPAIVGFVYIRPQQYWQPQALPSSKVA